MLIDKIINYIILTISICCVLTGIVSFIFSVIEYKELLDIGISVILFFIYFGIGFLFFKWSQHYKKINLKEEFIFEDKEVSLTYNDKKRNNTIIDFYTFLVEFLAWIVHKIGLVIIYILGISTQIAWLFFLFGSVIGVVLLLIFCKNCFLQPINIAGWIMCYWDKLFGKAIANP